MDEERTIWAYEALMVKRAISRTREDLAQTIVGVVASALITAGVEATIKGSVDWTTALMALVGGIGGTLVVILLAIADEPRKVHNEMVADLNANTVNQTFAGTLIERENDFARILATDNSEESLAMARKHLEAIQEMVVKVLWLPESEWKHPPFGWGDKSAPPLAVWAGLAMVFHQRYPHDLMNPAVLYGDAGRIESANLPAVIRFSERLVTLIRREVQAPHKARTTENPGTFGSVVDVYSFRTT